MDTRQARRIPFTAGPQQVQALGDTIARVHTADHDALVAELRARGVRFLAPSDAEAGPERLSDEQLLASLAQHPDPRLRLALIPWFILHPEIHALVPVVMQKLPPAARVELEALYMAAVYLQRLWRTRLGFYLGDYSELPDRFSSALGLPSPAERHGKVGLHVLAEWHAQHSDYPVNRLSSYNKMMGFLFEQLKQEARDHAP